MSSWRKSSSEEQDKCPICLDVPSEPVSTPCGHTFCRQCITEAWSKTEGYECPQCYRRFSSRPQLSEVDPEPRPQRRQSKEYVKNFSKVLCDACSEPKLEALKSCLVCLSSFCESHLQPHLNAPGLKTHQLVDPLDDLEDRLCHQHQHPLELFCVPDKRTICMMCSVLEHRGHKLLPLDEACKRSRASLQLCQTQTQTMVDQRRQKVQEIQDRLELSEGEHQAEVTAGLQTFTALLEQVQRHKDLFLEELQRKHRSNQRQAQDLLLQLQQEMSELEKSIAEAQQLSLSTDPLYFLQHCPALPPGGLRDWSSVVFQPEESKGSAARALSELESGLSKDLHKVLKREASGSIKSELRRVQQFAVEVTLDPDTAHPKLVLSEDLKQVHHCDVRRKLALVAQRFDTCPNVLGKQSFSTGSFYFEVQVKGKTEWDVGVVQESINRKGQTILSPKNGYWTVGLLNQWEVMANAGPAAPLSLPRPPQRVGVFVDYEAGLVSFYDSDSAELIYSFTGCSFREKLRPLFCPGLNYKGKNSVPLRICTVDRLGRKLSRQRPVSYK